MAINTGSRTADTTDVKPNLRKDLLFGGTAGMAVVATLALTVTTMGPLLGVEWPGAALTGESAEQVNIPAAVVERPRARRMPAPDAPRVRVSVERSSSDADRRRRQASSGNSPERASRRVDVPATSLPPARTESGDSAPATTPAATTVAAAAAVTTPATTAPARTRGVTLRVASVAVVSDDGADAPELRVGLAITNGTATAGVPEQVTVRLRPELPAATETGGSALALRAHIDVVDAVAGRGAASAGASPLQMRVRMAFAAAEGSEPTVADRGDGDGQSNVLDVQVPLSALASTPTQPPATEPPPTEPPATDPPASEPPAADPALESEIRLDLVSPTSSDDEVGETTDVAVPADPTQPAPPADSMAVTVVVDSSAPATATPAAETTTEPAATDPAAARTADAAAATPAVP